MKLHHFLTEGACGLNISLLPLEPREAVQCMPKQPHVFEFPRQCNAAHYERVRHREVLLIGMCQPEIEQSLCQTRLVLKLLVVGHTLLLQGERDGVTSLAQSQLSCHTQGFGSRLGTHSTVRERERRFQKIPTLIERPTCHPMPPQRCAQTERKICFLVLNEEGVRGPQVLLL